MCVVVLSLMPEKYVNTDCGEKVALHRRKIREKATVVSSVVRLGRRLKG